MSLVGRGWGAVIRAALVAWIIIPAVPDHAAARSQNPLRLVVLGDSLGDGVWIGLKRVMSGHGDIDVVRRSRVSTGFARPDFYDWNAELPKILAEGPVDVAVVVMGTNDQQPMRVGNTRAAVLSKPWRDIYEQRAREFAALLARNGIATYWVGLPIMRSPKFSRNVERINAIFRTISTHVGINYIDTWGDFADERGRYQPYGPDLSGRTRKLRANDGIHFTMQGYERLAHPVAQAILVDLSSRSQKRAHTGSPAAPEQEARPGGAATIQDAAPIPTIRPARREAMDPVPIPQPRPEWLKRFTLRAITL